ncbi:FUSC family protein [Sabulilitoribacter arenilitoris]|uniref:FUSC family protein n=1 Tax=Wocania arenilitoris TaxID=2044858 RepID=A0AAE3ENM8_9FLAO|nr:FUSC family protein [Wocania arenilitoris]MCF7568137.1 FUSC family protein [Wocania arenilitoris]
MKKIFTILAIIASVLAIMLSVLPLSNLAIIPSIIALICGLIAFYLSKKSGEVKKIIQFTFLLTIIALALTTYKSLFNTAEVTNIEALEKKEVTSKEEAIEELNDIDIDEDEIEGEIEAEDIHIDG